MINLHRREAMPPVFKRISIFFAALVFIAAGCSAERDADDGVLSNVLLLPTDLLLNLACENVGIGSEPCVLDDPENPYANVTILEFDVNNPQASNKFELFSAIPAGPTGAKARFYFWATALAGRQSGENQWYTARALHELYTYNQDDLIRRQALKAYRSNLDNFFGSAVFFDVFGFGIPASLNEQVACDLIRPPNEGGIQYAEIVPGTGGMPVNDLDKLQLFGQWGYIYLPGPNFNDPGVSGQEQCAGGVLSVIAF